MLSFELDASPTLLDELDLRLEKVFIGGNTHAMADPSDPDTCGCTVSCDTCECTVSCDTCGCA